MQLGGRRSSGVGGIVLGILVLAALVAGGGALYVGNRAGGPVSLDVRAEAPALGRRPVKLAIVAAEPVRGLVSVEVSVAQGTFTKVLAKESFAPQPAHAPWAPRTASATISVTLSREQLPELVEGEVIVRVSSAPAGTWMKTPEATTRELKLPVKLTPPALSVLSTQTFAAQGGVEAVVYSVGPSATQHGVRAGSWFFPGHPLPGEGGRQFALFAVPYDLGTADGVRLVASDEAGNEAEASFIDQFKARPYKEETLQVTEKVMATVVPKILAETPTFKDRGALVANYVAINSELRRENAEQLIALAKKSRPEFLWRKRFLPMGNAKVVSSFADRRTYMFEGQKIDQQDHLGFDLASTQKAPVPAANDGQVVLAGFFGIYGNAVVIDHGYGLQSLYGHLSSLDVKVGERVTRGQTLGRTGATGLALGDHLHFTMLLCGLAVTPVEWWDHHWIQDRLVLKLGAALPLEED